MGRACRLTWEYSVRGRGLLHFTGGLIEQSYAANVSQTLNWSTSRLAEQRISFLGGRLFGWACSEGLALLLRNVVVL